jgi:hypothetical protein
MQNTPKANSGITSDCSMIVGKLNHHTNGVSVRSYSAAGGKIIIRLCSVPISPYPANS